LHPLDAAVGPFCDSTDLVAWHGDSLDGVLACQTSDKRTVYPSWQFLPGGRTIPHLSAVLAELQVGTEDPWTQAIWLRSPSDDLGGMSAVEWLSTGRDPEPVLAVARDDASRWAA
jgi:hypothetical protein